MNNIFQHKEIEQHLHLLESWEQEAFEAFKEKMTNRVRPFPCIPATKGFHCNHLRYAFIAEIEKDVSIAKLSNVLKTYGSISRECGAYTSLIIFFYSASTHTLHEYEQLFWKTLAGVSELDESPCGGVSLQNPHDPAWEFSFNGESYFVYCATPEHKKRRSRSFPLMMLAITPRWVLQHFHRTQPNVEQMKSLVRKRLAAYDEAPVHPELKWYGEKDNYEWKQYFLRDDETTLQSCPFANYLNKKQS